MPADRHGAGFAGHRLTAGSYAKLLRNDCDRRCAPDPRLYPVETVPDGAAEWEDLKAAGVARATEMFDELAAVGEPIVVPTGYAPRAGGPEWLSTPAIYGGASLVRVHRDDVCEPAEFYGDRLPNGAFDRIPVPARHRP
jgi:hypothetical protein